ncbi:MAG TPA: hypothetical protein VNT53_10945 [Pseudolysinimonas sp.]|nr:hypothetical protein [Pseudolysinimonas sp.]
MRILPLGLAAAALVLTGCVQPSPSPSSPAPSATAVFASEDEALAAAKAAYEKYQTVTNALGNDGWKDTSQLASVARSAALRDEIKTASEFAAKGYVLVGQSSFDSMRLQSTDYSGRGKVVLTVYACVDVSGTDVRDATGASVVPANRDSRVPFEIDIDNHDDGILKVARSEAWSGEDFC